MDSHRHKEIRMPLDPKSKHDWEIAEDAEKTMKTVFQLGNELGLSPDELLPRGNYLGKLDYRKILDRLNQKPTAN